LSDGPRTEYSRRLAAWRDEEKRLEANDSRWSRLRGAAGLAALLLGFGAFGLKQVPAYALAPPVAVLAALVVIHERDVRRRERARRAIRHYERAMRRLDGVLRGDTGTGAEFLDPRHLYAADLDVLGPGSLFELISTARTREGEATLAAWLLAPATHEEASKRQEAVKELRDRVSLREELALEGEEIRAGLEEKALRAWAAAPPAALPAAGRPLCIGAALLTAGSFLGWLGQLWPLWPFLLMTLGVFAIQLWLRPRVEPVMESLDAPARDLRLVAAILARLEREDVKCERLLEVRGRLRAEGRAASAEIAGLRKLVDRHDDAHNQFFAPFAFLLLWTPLLAYKVESWRRRCGGRAADWIGAIAEFEALCSLAGYAYEHPSTVFPELLSGGREFDSEGLAHPLLPEDRAVVNDVRLGEQPRILVVSGSNMSGKSTLLRAVGLNTALAWAGAPVRAKRLRVSRLAVGASLRTVDSLQEGRSRFYAEITRIREILDLTRKGPPVLFLLDELLSGTNSHDRQAGAEGILRSLLDRGAIGLTTTHDLALVRIGDSLAPLAANVHFEDSYTDSGIHFDYWMKPGPVQRSNAIALMRSVGLDVGGP